VCVRRSRVFEGSRGGGGSSRQRSSSAMDVTDEQQHRARLLDLLEPRAARVART